MAIFNKEYIKKYNQNKEVLNESLLTVGLFIILSPFILLFSAITIFCIYCDKTISDGIKKDKINFENMIKKYPKLKKIVMDIVRKTQDFLIKKIKLKYHELEYKDVNFNAFNINYNKDNTPSKYTEYILYANPERYLKTTELSKYIDSKYGEYYIIENIEEKFYYSDRKEYNRLYKLFVDICDTLYEDYTEINKYLKVCNEELRNEPNGDIIKLSTSIYEPGETNSDFPMCFIKIEIDISKIKMTDEVEEKINELRAKSGKYLKN